VVALTAAALAAVSSAAETGQPKPCCVSTAEHREEFAPTDGEYVVKYFLVDKAKKHNSVDLRMNHPPKGERRSRD